jgi:hypothetical protein
LVAFLFFRFGQRFNSKVEKTEEDGFTKPELADTQSQGPIPGLNERHELEDKRRIVKLKNVQVPVEMGMSERDELDLERRVDGRGRELQQV